LPTVVARSGAALLGLLATVLLVGFRGSVPFAFASHHICETLERACSAPLFGQVFGGGDSLDGFGWPRASMSNVKHRSIFI
jgi:hypothetical protein